MGEQLKASNKFDCLDWTTTRAADVNNGSAIPSVHGAADGARRGSKQICKLQRQRGRGRGRVTYVQPAAAAAVRVYGCNLAEWRTQLQQKLEKAMVMSSRIRYT